MLFNDKNLKMFIIKNLTPEIKYKRLKMMNHFYEMLTATVSHDMRTPLNSMIGLLNTLDLFIDENGKRFLNIIKSSSNFLLFLVNDLLDFFQIKNGKFKKNEGWVDLRECLKDLIEMLNGQAQEIGLILIYNCDPTLPSSLYLDQQRIKQILLNLVQNALKFT